MSARPALLLRPLVAVVAGLVLLTSAGPARADMVYIGDTILPGQFNGTVSVSFQSTTSAVIQVSLTNTSPTLNGGYITGLAFNDPAKAAKGDISGVTSFTPSYSPATGQQFSLLGGGTSFVNGISTSPYGSFDIGAAVGGNWLGGGQPSDGLAVGETGVFTFNVAGTGLNNLTAANLLAAMSTNGTAGFAVRFRGFADGSSDKDIAGIIISPPPPPPPPPPKGVPAPPGLVLAGMGFGCLLIGRLRFRRKPAPQA